MHYIVIVLIILHYSLIFTPTVHTGLSTHVYMYTGAYLCVVYYAYLYAHTYV